MQEGCRGRSLLCAIAVFIMGTPCTYNVCLLHKYIHTHTHTRLMALFPGLPRWAGTRKVKPIWISLKQETVSGSGISWDICKSAPHSRLITTPAPQPLSFLQAGCPSCRPTNSVKALKATIHTYIHTNLYSAKNRENESEVLAQDD